MKKYILIVFILFSAGAIQAQVIISLLFGEALNTDKIEFGLTGGLNRSYLPDIKEADPLNNFNLGFYFHIMLTQKSFISTGVLVKSNVGGTGMPTYPVGIENLDALFENGKRTTKISIFYVPVMYQQRFNKQIFIEGGIQPGLRTKAFDNFDASAAGGDISYKREVSDDYTRLDFGIIGGGGYKLQKTLKSTSIGVLYYLGLVDMYKNPELKSRNSSLNFYLRIPIGIGKE